MKDGGVCWITDEDVEPQPIAFIAGNQIIDKWDVVAI